jgi:hypothetical protein
MSSRQITTYLRICFSCIKEPKRAAQPVSQLAALPISPLFVPTMVLLRGIFFIDTDKTRYVSVGFYPARSFDVLVEFGGPKLRPIVLVDKYVRTLAEHLPDLCEKMFHDEQYRCEMISDCLRRVVTALPS